MSEIRRISFDVEVTPSAILSGTPAAQPWSRITEGLEARLDKTGTHVVCGQTKSMGGIECGARLATVVRLADEMPDSDEWARRPGYAAQPHIRFLPGWARGRNGVWVLTKYAAKRVRRGKTPKLKRYPANDGVEPNDVMDSPYSGLPVLARCPQCDTVNEVTPDRTGVRFVCVVPASP